MTQFGSARASLGQSRTPRYTQAELSQFLDAHERFARGQSGGRRAIWRYGQAPASDFSGRLLRLADLTGANLQGARLVETNFERACLHFSDLRAVDAQRANFHQADIRGVSLRNANLCGANFDDADMRQAVLVPAGVSEDFRLADRPPSGELAPGEVAFEVDFTNCSMKQARLSAAKLNRANLTGAFLAGADLTAADLRGAKFKGAVLTGVKFGDVKLDPDALAACVLDPTARALGRVAELLARLADADRWIASNGVEGSAADLDGEDLRPLGSALSGRLLTAISARRACAVGMSFAGAQLQGGRFDDADLRDVDFTEADLRGASFRGAQLRFARFAGADLRPLPLANGGVRAVDLAGADYAADAFSAGRQS